MKLLIITIVFIGIAVVVGTIFIGAKTFDGTVVDMPYERGINYDKTQRALKDFSVVSENQVLLRGDNQFVFSIKPNTERPLKIDSAAVTITKPSTNRFDWTYEAKPQPEGKYIALIKLPDHGRWEIRVSFMVDNQLLTYPFLYNVR